MMITEEPLELGNNKNTTSVWNIVFCPQLWTWQWHVTLRYVKNVIRQNLYLICSIFQKLLIRVKLSLCLIKHHAMKIYGGVVSFTPLPLNPLYPLDRMLGVPVYLVVCLPGNCILSLYFHFPCGIRSLLWSFFTYYNTAQSGIFISCTV
jgi:hypothetical protein